VQSTESNAGSRVQVKSLIAEGRASLERVGDGDWTPQDTLLSLALTALVAERDRADRAEADSKRIQMVRDALTQYEDGKYGPLAYLVREIDRVVNNTKDDEMDEATA